MVQDQAFWLWDFLGRLHPLAVHFPVGLLLFAWVLELFTLKNYHSRFRAGIEALVIAGTISAVIAALFGWLLFLYGDYSGDTINLHQWTGYATAVLSLLTFSAMLLTRKNPKRSYIITYRSLLFTTGIGVAVAGHFGATLTHGELFPKTSSSAKDKGAIDKPSANFNLEALQADTGKLSVQQVSDLNVEVRAILAHNCYKCHGPEKIKGGLRLDGKHMVLKGGENGPVIVPGNPEKSELFIRINLPADHEDVMPSKGKKLKDKDIEIIKLWIKKGAPWPEDGSKAIIYKVAELMPRNPELPDAPAGLSGGAKSKHNNPVDRWTDQYFIKNKTKWPEVVNDQLYLRRVYLDIIGMLPNPEEIEKFSQDERPNKRELWVRQLLNMEDDYAMHWLSFWNDALRNDYTGTGYITGGRFNITDWLYKSLKNNKPYNQFVKELISPTEESKGFIEGIKWRGVVNSSQRTEMQAAQNVSQVFLGLNLKCASCHNSFISDWKLEDAYAFANIFADTTLEINRCDKPTGKYVDARMLWKELGTIDNKATVAVKRKQLAENLIKPENGRLYRTIVNRIWAQMMGRGLIEPVDVMDNEPWNQDLLDWMAYDFVAKKTDLKELIYLIATSKAYQLPSVGYKEAAIISNPKYKFKGMVRRRMSAEQFTDAVSHIISPVFNDTELKYNPFLKAAYNKLSAKPPFVRASLVANNSFLTALGRPNRETVSTGRDSQANLLQALELTNGGQFNAVLKEGAQSWIKEFNEPDLLIRNIYKKTLGREPGQKEIAIARKAIGNTPQADAVQDLFWAIVLLPEFQIIY